MLKVNTRLVIVKSVIISVIYLLFIPIIHGVSNLERVFVAEVLEKFVSLIGIILLVPLCSTEIDNTFKECVYIKSFSYHKIILLRLIISIFVLCLLIFIFSICLIFNNCDFPFFKYTFGGIITALTLGGIGFVVVIISNNLVVGYLSSISFFIINWIGIINDNNPVYIFSMINEEYYQKIVLLIIFILNIIFSFLWLLIINKNSNRVFLR